MDSLRVGFIFMASITFCVLATELSLNFDYRSVTFLNSNVCPSDNIIMETYLYKIACTNLCALHYGCTGIFFQQEQNHCILCSAKFLTQENGNISTNYKFYGVNSTVTVYWIVEQLMARDNVQEECEKHSGTLASIKTSEENDYLVQHVLGNCVYGLWTGGYGRGSQAETFEWFDGSLLKNGFTNWQPEQPNDQANEFACVAIDPASDFEWIDGSCLGEQYGLCNFNYN